MSRPRTTPRPPGSRFVRCLLCADGRTITLNNFTTHIKNRHPERAGQRRTEFYAELGAAPGLALAVPEPAPLPAAPPLPPLQADDIVQTVAEQLAGPAGAFPVELLPALFAWREATEAFLRSARAGRG